MKKFTKTIEDFICENCGAKVIGTGYTNHCPKCLFSRHVDVNPGDRANICGGMMEPIGVEAKKNGYVITHKCKKCGISKKNKADKADDFEQILRLTVKS